MKTEDKKLEDKGLLVTTKKGVTTVFCDGKTIAMYKGVNARLLKKAIQKHLDDGGTIGNYQW